MAAPWPFSLLFGAALPAAFTLGAKLSRDNAKEGLDALPDQVPFRMDCNYLKGRDGDRTNAILAAAGYNFSLLLRWLAALLRGLIAAFSNRGTAAQIA